MAFFGLFGKKNSSKAEEQPQKQQLSIRDLQARAYNQWVGEGNAEPRNTRRPSHFEEERARRSHDNGNVVMRSSM